MKYQTIKPEHDEEDGLLHNTETKKNWNIWSILNVLVWTLTACLLINGLINRTPNPIDIKNKVKNIEQAVGSIDVGATLLNALNADVQNIEDRAVVVERKDPHELPEYKENWPNYNFRDHFGLRVKYTDVLGKFHDADLLSENLSIMIDNVVMSDVHIEAVDMKTEQALVKVPIEHPGTLLLDCEDCYEKLKKEETVENCDCRVLTAHTHKKHSEIAVGTETSTIEFGGKTYTIHAQLKESADACPNDQCRKDLYISHYGDPECLAGLNVVDTPNGTKFIKDLKIDEYIRTGQNADGSANYNRIVYLVAKGLSRHIKLELEDGSFVTLTHNHNVITENGEIASAKATLKDSLKHEDGTFKKIVSIEHNVIDDTYIVRTTAFNGHIWMNGLYGSENTIGDMTYFRKAHNFIGFKIVCRFPYFANFVHNYPRFGHYIDMPILIMVASMVSYGLRRKERSLKLD